ncbi:MULTISPECIES: TrbC/VirB2 family protein [Rhodomicrobium]|uniref:TrbC/VirB2 family protein n=1 Tax=Rhodomicrobium TaxID=1068 RepID=UPI001FDA2E40|nr:MULTISPECIES: TrbC/VirB2 family protein [Rhodomicrobium]
MMTRSVQIDPGTAGHIDQRCGLAAKRPAAPRYLRLPIQCSVAIVLTLIVLAAMGQEAHAAGSGLPWEAPLERILESIEGPVAKVIAVLSIIVTGLSLAFGDMSGGFRRLIQIVFGLTIAFAATSFFLTFFSFAGGALIN